MNERSVKVPMKVVGFLIVCLLMAALVSAGLAVGVTVAWNALARYAKLGTIPFVYAWVPLFVLTLATSRLTIKFER